MRNIFKKIIIATILTIVVLIAVHPQVANAVNNCFPIPNVKACVIEVMSNLSEMIQSVMSWFLSICGAVLNMSILLTLNMKAIYQATPAIEQVWIVIRNIASIFIIFGLLYTSICTILDIGKTSVSAMVKNIIIAGLLINFSLLFARTMIDASNLVSMQFYRAIAPNTIGMTIGKDGIGSVLSSSFKKGGISDAFMSSLKIPKIYDKKQGILQAVNAGLLIIIHTYMGALMMIIAGLSFIAAALAFTARIAILLLIMAFSPLYFVGIIFPKIKEHTKEYENMFINQLIFMPVYLLLTYVSLRFLSGGFFSAIVSNKSDTAASLVLADVGMIFQYVIALIMINVPLIAALKLGAMAPKWAEGVKEMAMNFTGQHIVGRGAKRLQGAIASSPLAARVPNLAVLANKSLGGIAGASFGGSKGGYEKRFKEFSKARADYAGKSLKLGKSEKNNVDIQTSAAVKTEMEKWDREALVIEKEIKEAEVNLAEAAILGGAVEEKAQKKLDDLRNRLSQRGSREDYESKTSKAKKDEIEAKALKDKKEQFARSLEGGFPNPFTSKARKDAADAIRKAMKKSKKDKLVDAVKELQDEEKPDKEEEGDKKK